jgi:hypothetical protein
MEKTKEKYMKSYMNEINSYQKFTSFEELADAIITGKFKIPDVEDAAVQDEPIDIPDIANNAQIFFIPFQKEEREKYTDFIQHIIASYEDEDSDFDFHIEDIYISNVDKNPTLAIEFEAWYHGYTVEYNKDGVRVIVQTYDEDGDVTQRNLYTMYF